MKWVCPECGLSSRRVYKENGKRTIVCTTCKGGGDLDYSKLTPQDIEMLGVRSTRVDERKMKRQGFERRMDRAKKALAHAKTEKDVQKYSRIVRQTQITYDKYK